MNYSHISRFSINLNLKKILIFLSSIIFKINCKKISLKLKSILKTNNIVLTSQGRSALFYILKSIISDKKEK